MLRKKETTAAGTERPGIQSGAGSACRTKTEGLETFCKAQLEAHCRCRLCSRSGRCVPAAREGRKTGRRRYRLSGKRGGAPEITNVFSGSGTIAAANTYTVNALVSGTVLTADFAVGDTIEEGTVLYTIDSSNAANSVEKAQRNYEDAADAQYVRSTIGGTLTSYKVAVGDVVTAGQEVATVRDASTLLLTLEFPAADAANFTVGQAAQVTLDGTFEAVSGTVRSVSGADAPEQREPAGAHRDHCGEQHRQPDHRAGCNGQVQRGQRTGIGKIQLPERADHHRLYRRHQ